MDLDRSLDTILKGKAKKPRRANKPADGVSKAKPATKSAKIAAREIVGAARKPATPTATKIIVHGLPSDVTEKQIREYMTAEVGPVSRIELSYDKNGASKGVVTVQFGSGGDYANKAANLLNGRVVDGRGPKPSKMRVEIVQAVKEPGLADRIGSTTPKTTSNDAEVLARAVSAATSGATLTKKEKSALRRVVGAGTNTKAGNAKVGTKTGTKAGTKAVGTKLVKSGPGRVKRVAKTAAELDAEMTDYFDKAAK